MGSFKSAAIVLGVVSSASLVTGLTFSRTVRTTPCLGCGRRSSPALPSRDLPLADDDTIEFRDNFRTALAAAVLASSLSICVAGVGAADAATLQSFKEAIADGSVRVWDGDRAACGVLERLIGPTESTLVGNPLNLGTIVISENAFAPAVGPGPIDDDAVGAGKRAGEFITLAYIGFSLLAGFKELAVRFKKWQDNRS
mmetsp:Transcript_10154/g.21396  ORF Transcript_10154/g.21396 Transcript_10154/m.21396 type:complete len:198 (-) Transcript_10154:158-751(-)|eukprot:CAMPEP_0183295700 /NCGR_PEP_ID=MMETSP0160_2-20130417/3558_1 /TAXON_ID=2839 ORGANISM="Odontella Sinensis, Strain Grunow 1884" /NCGR_SAMPLE_ID=MMETSP0160_2 /ASSEMBLY_ACC=CAM_ASM_000250 /LENGTH=197 /DNA_ID=CAMNT_0025457223 /DNA_START=51 /DNA_END=644 /DNA_ORIENTATION=+